MEGSASRCQGCGDPLPPSRGGHPRKWCSERCRKQTLYSVPCVACGEPLNGSNGRGPNAPSLCVMCNGEKEGERQRQRFAEGRAKVERLWAEGKVAREIAAEMGWPYRRLPSGSNTANVRICCLRSRGYDLPQRRPQMVAAGQRLARSRPEARAAG